jgi:hypothetical protein
MVHVPSAKTMAATYDVLLESTTPVKGREDIVMAMNRA